MDETTKIKDLNIDSKRVNVLAKVVNIGEPKNIQTRFGDTKKLTEAVVGDDSGIITMTLWEDQVNTIKEGQTIFIENGYVSLVRGHFRLNIGKYGTIKENDTPVDEVNTENDMSAPEHEREFRNNRYNRGGYSNRKRDYRSNRY